MRSSILGLVTGVVALPAMLALYSCGSSNGTLPGTGGGMDAGLRGDGQSGNMDSPQFGFPDGGLGSSDTQAPFMDASFNAPDCPGCTFPPLTAPACAASTPAINVVYPNDNVLVPPNMNVISVQWTPFGTPFQEFEVDFRNSITDMRVITKCTAETMDTEQPPQASDGCELQLDPTMWQFVANQNRGGESLNITVRGTTDGMCASASANSVRLSFAEEDLLGALYYWKSTVTANGVGGQIWVKSFGDSNPEQNVTAGLMTTCNGCHALSRDGARMVINSDDDDSDDEYSDVNGSLIDMASRMPIGTFAGQAPGFSTFYPDHTQYVSSDGLAVPPTNIFSIFDGNSAAMLGTAGNLLATTARPTMPDWSPDGKTVLFVAPGQVAAWNNSHGNPLSDDAHVFGGSLYTMPYMGNMTFGTPTALLTSAGENNYYPGYSPDGQLVIFDRAPHDTTVANVSDCVTTPHAACPNDSFSNPAARVMLMPAMAGATPRDLEAANGSPAAMPVPVSNSWPKFSPFLQGYKGDRLLWVAFSSTRDYGVRVRNHQPGLYQCYPADSYENPGQAHGQPFDSACQQPQLWMAAIDVSTAEVGNTMLDPSRTAFWLPFQDITTHNHTPQWTQTIATVSNDAGACVPAGGNCQQNPAGCCQGVCQADGTCGSLPQ